jgi:hypothetical protein
MKFCNIRVGQLTKIIIYYWQSSSGRKPLKPLAIIIWEDTIKTIGDHTVIRKPLKPT